MYLGRIKIANLCWYFLQSLSELKLTSRQNNNLTHTSGLVLLSLLTEIHFQACTLSLRISEAYTKFILFPNAILFLLYFILLYIFATLLVVFFWAVCFFYVPIPLYPPTLPVQTPLSKRTYLQHFTTQHLFYKTFVTTFFSFFWTFFFFQIFQWIEMISFEKCKCLYFPNYFYLCS